MDKDRIIELAREVGAGEPESLYGRTDYVVMTVGDLERFAALIERELVLDMLQRQPETNCHGDGNVYRGVRCKDSSKPTCVWPFIETAK